MITKTTILGPEYFDLFAEIEAKSNGSIKVNNLEDFFGNIQEIAALDESFLRLPLDEPMFEIDANSRKINVETTPFKANGLSVQGDHLAETVFFKIDKYFDYMDLMNADIYIDWKMGGVSGCDKCFIKSDAIIPGYIVFGWPISNAITKKGGALQFAVKLEMKQDDKVVYSFNTLVASLNIKDGLVLVDPEVYDMKSNINSILSNSSFGEGSAAVADVVFAQELADGLGADFVEVINLDSSVNDGVCSSVPKQLIAVAGAGRDASIVYSDKEKKVFTADTFVAVPADSVLNDNLVYYVSAGVDAYAPASNEQIAAFGTEDAVELFVQAAKIIIDGVGEYYVNAQGIKRDENDVKIGASSIKASKVVKVLPAEVPSVVTVEGPSSEVPEGYEIMEGTKTIFLQKDGSIVLNATAELENGVGLLSFVWEKTGAEAPIRDEGYKPAATDALTVSAEGEYTVTAKHFRNKVYAEPVKSESCLVSYYASKITANHDVTNVLTLAKAANGAFVKGSTGTVNIAYEFADSNDAFSTEMKFELLDTNGNVIPATFAHGQAGVEVCTINSANIAEDGFFKFRVSNIYNGSIYSVETEQFWINVE